MSEVTARAETAGARRRGGARRALAALGTLALLGGLEAGCRRELQVLTPRVDGGARDGGPPEASDAGVDAGAALRGAADLASSSEHVCALDRGAMFCWGANGSGQLGDGARDDASTPRRMGQRGDWVEVAPGDGFTCARTLAGDAYCWGENSSGQLGQGDVVDRLEPTRVPGGPWARLASGQRHVCAIDEAGALFCWGANAEGQIGQDDAAGAPDVLAPTEVTAGTRYRDVDGADGHTCAIREPDGAVLCWGRNTNAQLGIGSGAASQVRTPTLASGASHRAIAIAQHHSCALRDDGTLWCWGEDTHGEIGQGLGVGTGALFEEPVQVGVRDDWTDLAVHWFNTCVLAADGTARCAGRGIEGQLGRDSLEPSGELVPVVFEEAFARIALGRFHACAQIASGGVFCWGANSEGQLGTGDLDRRRVPAPVQ